MTTFLWITTLMYINDILIQPIFTFSIYIMITINNNCEFSFFFINYYNKWPLFYELLQ